MMHASNAAGSPQTLWTAFAVGFFFSFRAALVMITARWLGAGTEAGVAATVAIEGTLLLALLFQQFGAAVHSISWIARQSSVRWVLLFLAFSCTSLLWSATASRPASFLYWCAMAADVALIAVLLRGAPPSDVAHSLMRGFIVSACVLACIAWIMPVTEDLRLGDPDYFNTNQVGNLCALAILMAQFLSRQNVGKWKLPIFFLTITLVRSLSKATIIAFIVAEGFLFIYDKSTSRKKKAAIAIAAVLLISVFAGLIGSYIDTYTSESQAQSLTGRTGIWLYTLDASLDRPWFGNGIDAMWKVFPPFGRDMFEARHAENELLQLFFTYGIAGIVMLAGLYGSLYRRILALSTRSSKAVLIALMLFTFIRGLAEAEPFDLLLPLWMISLISCIVEEAQPSRNRHLIPAAEPAPLIAGSPAL